MKNTLPEDDNASAPFPTIPSTADIKPLTRKAMKQKTRREQLVETTRIGIPIVVIASLVFGSVGLLYTNIMSSIAALSEKMESLRKDQSDKSERLIRVELQQAYFQKSLDDMAAKRK